MEEHEDEPGVGFMPDAEMGKKDEGDPENGSKKNANDVVGNINNAADNNKNLSSQITAQYKKSHNGIISTDEIVLEPDAGDGGGNNINSSTNNFILLATEK